MADFAPPTGPPPPKVPEGWKAVWNDQYSEWFFVNIYTKKSQWDKPTSPIYPPGGDAPPDGPPAYDSSAAKPLGPEKGGPNMTEDERLARQLQEEENARAQGAAGPATGARTGAADGYYNDAYAQPPPGAAGYGAPQGQQYGAPQGQYGSPGPSGAPQKKGMLGGLLGKLSGKQQQQPQYQQGYGAPMGQPGYGYSQQGMMGRGGRKPGMGAGGAAALGAGGGLLGGMMLGSALDGHHGGGDYGGDDGGHYGGDDGGNYGGDDGGDGGDFGGDGGDFGGDGGGDFGGGDFGGD